MQSVSPLRQNQIRELLKELERVNNITIVHAVESGSRAWGFPSFDSDYDIRFIYHHPQEWYISAFEQKDHIALEISDDLDTGGWDIAKTLRLLNKGNAVAHEWLHSPVVYCSDELKTTLLKDLAAEVFNPTSAFYHYRSLAKKKLLDDATKSNAKYFLYGLRSLLCAQWISEKATAPPVIFAELVSKYLAVEEQSQLSEVLRVKARGGEKDNFQIPNGLWRFSNELNQALSSVAVSSDKRVELDRFDLVLRTIVK